MAYSMTGFGRCEKVYGSRKYSIELKSVNSRYCDINIRMPRSFNFIEADIRKTLSNRLIRGKVDVYIIFDDLDSETTEVVLNKGLALEYSNALKQIAEITGRTDESTAARISMYQDVLVARQKNIDEDILANELMSTLDEAIDGMLKMRQVEGDNLVKDLLSKIDILSDLRNQIDDRSSLVVQEYKQRLNDRINSILTTESRELFDENRLALEVAVFADKCAIDEELQRLISHFQQARSILGLSGAIGKKMDFLIQEINREINTIGSKANDLSITNNVMLMKNEVEKIREQTQNLV